MSFTPYLTEPRNFLSDLDRALENAFGRPANNADRDSRRASAPAQTLAQARSDAPRFGAQSQPQSTGTLTDATVAQTVAAPFASALSQPGAERARAADALGDAHTPLNQDRNREREVAAQRRMFARYTRFLVLRGR